MGVDIQTYRAKIGTYRHSYGVDVITQVIVINYSNGLKSIGCVLFIGILLIMAGVEQNPGPRNNDEICDPDESNFEQDVLKRDEAGVDNIPSTNIKVTGLPKGATNEVLIMFFENEKRQGGGRVRDVILVDEGNSAIVDFEDASAVDKVMQNTPINILGHKVNVEVFVADGSTSNTRPTKIEVIGLPEGITDEILIMFFENEHRQGGGPVKCVTIDDDKHIGVVEFEEAESVETVMQKQPIVIFDTQVKIQIIRKQQLKTEEVIKTIKVSGLPKMVTDEILLMFFENENRQGGGKVTEIRLNKKEDSALIEFEEEKVWKNISPKLFLKSNVQSEKNEKVRKTLANQIRDVERQKAAAMNEVDELKAQLKLLEETRDEVRRLNQTLELSEKTRQQLEEEIQGLNRQKAAVTEKLNNKVSLLEEKNNTLSEKNNNLNTKLASANVKYERLQCVSQADRSNIISLSSDLKKLEETCREKYFTKTVLNFILQSEEHEKVRKALANQIRDVDRQKEAAMNEVDELKVQLKLLEETRDDARHEVSCHSEVESSSDILQREEDQNEYEMFGQLLQKLGLMTKYPGKISIQDVIVVDPNEAADQSKTCTSLEDLPWIMLKRLICAHSESRDTTASGENNLETSIDLETTMFIYDVPEENQDISPLDIFTVVYQCCDPIMKQIFFQKLYLCKIAVPFLYKHWEPDHPHQSIISVWPLRSLAIENRSSHLKNKDVDLLEIETKVIAFARLGRPRFSKSKLLNSLLSNQGCKTFFNIDCPSGMTPRYLSDGQVEMFWLPMIGNNKDRFQDAMTFLNMRGDLSENFDVTILSFMARFADAITIIIDLESILKRAKQVKSLLLNFSSVILVIANPVRQDEKKKIENFKTDVLALKPDIHLCVMSTHKGVIEQNVVDMVSSVSMRIKEQLLSISTQSFQERLNYAMSDKLKTDEQGKDCEHGRKQAEELVQQMKIDGKSGQWKQLLTPVHSIYSQQLGKLLKKREREKGFTEGATVDSEISQVLETQTQSITKTVKLFIDILLRNEKSPLKLKLFLCWLHFYIEREKRKILPQLMNVNRCAWERLKTLKSKETKVPSEIKDQEAFITQTEAEIDKASFSVQHFFREVGHIYEAFLEQREKLYKFGLPPLDKIAKIIGNLIADGHQLELIDGESFYMAFSWTKAVLNQVERNIGADKVIALSVLGLQSSGKSTLLNTMFGSQFTTRSGRCTRGIHLQLIPARVKGFEDCSSPFNYVLVVDTEGLRSPELSYVQHEHDNELATVITGIGDVTLFNIMGENTSEIRDILQVIVHAFLRLKMTNKKLDIRKSCAFIHQNVTDLSASENMLSGWSKLIQTLDEMTKESARSEGILEVSTFNQVIQFDSNTPVWYLKNLWQGNPPMARINNEYSETVVEMKCKILQKALQMENKSYKSLNDIIDHAHNLWKGVLNEDFVFSFRNSLEIKAYMEMEKAVQDELWRLECFIRDTLVDITHNIFARCHSKDQLRQIANTLIDDLKQLLADERSDTEKAIKLYFEKNKYKDITIQWKSQQYYRIEGLCSKLEIVIQEEVDKNLAKRSLEIFTLANHEIHEKELSRKSMDVANQYKGQELTPNKIENLFADIWQSFIYKVDTTSYSSEYRRDKMRRIFSEYLRSIFKKENALLKAALIVASNLEPLPNLTKLEGSFKYTGIDEKDISFSIWKNFTDLIKFINTMKQVGQRVNQMFEDIDKMIKSICKVNDEITEMIVNQFMFDLNECTKNIVWGNTEYGFKRSFDVKFYVHVSRHAQSVFEKHNDHYFKTQGIAARLEQYRMQQKISFEAHLSNRQSEDLAAKLFSNVIEIFAEEWVSQSLSNKLSTELYSALPGVKNMVIIEICTELLDKGIFKNFIRYVQTPKEYASMWITEKANSHLFGDEARAYATVASSLLNTVIRNVEECVHTVHTKYTREAALSMERWINDFQETLNGKNISIPPESFRSVRKVEHIEKVEYLTKEILRNLHASKETLQTKFSRQNSESVRWTYNNPIERIIKKIWGCSERCAFCGEPCAKNEDHIDSAHYSIQHRPSCCDGTRDRDIKTASLESCEFNIQSGNRHNCPAFGYQCNKRSRQPCSDEWHPFRDYKKYLPDWYIAPTSNMQDTSKFWMWFVTTYRNELRDFYDYKVDNIPSSWYDITKDEARNSLQNTYSV